MLNFKLDLFYGSAAEKVGFVFSVVVLKMCRLRFECRRGNCSVADVRVSHPGVSVTFVTGGACCQLLTAVHMYLVYT